MQEVHFQPVREYSESIVKLDLSWSQPSGGSSVVTRSEMGKDEDPRARREEPTAAITQSSLKRAHSAEDDNGLAKRARQRSSGGDLLTNSSAGDQKKSAAKKRTKASRSGKFTRHNQNVRPLESFWDATGDKVLIIGDRDDQRRQCRVYTKEEHQNQFGLRTKGEYQPLLMLFKSNVDENTYLRPRQFHVENKAGFNGLMDSYGLPRSEHGGPVENHGIDGLPHAIVEDPEGGSGKAQHIGLWHASDDVVDQKNEFARWTEKYGKENLWKRQPDGSYRGLDMLSRSGNWSAAADFMVMEGWPRVAVRVDDDRYADIRAHYSATGPQELLILSKSGDAYHSPHKLKRMEPTHFTEMMREAGLPPELGDKRQKAGPERLICSGQYELIGGATYEETAREAPEERKLFQIQSMSGKATSSYMSLSDFLNLGQSMIDRHAGLTDENGAATTTTESRAQKVMAELRGIMQRSRERSRTPESR